MENFYDVIEKNEEKRRRILAELIASGVRIPCTDGVIISEEAVIEAGAVILPNTQIYGKTKISANAEIGPSSIVEDCSVGENVKIISSHCYHSEIKKGAEIGPFARIRPDCVIEKNVRVGNFVELKKTTVADGAKISHLSYMGDCSVGEKVNVGCGVATANYDGRRKHRTVIGKGAFIGCGVTMVAPVSVGDNAFIAADSTITEDVPENGFSIARSRQTIKADWVVNKKDE